MANLFESYEHQYSTLTADITAQIGQLGGTTTKDRRQLISDIEKHVEEAQELLEQMDLEVREIENSKRTRCRTKVDCYRAELKRLTLEYIKARSIKQVGYDSPDDFNTNNEVRISVDQKQRLLNNSEQIERTGKKLEDGYRIVLETQEIGTEIMQNLHHQRETIQRSRARLRETNEDLSLSSRIMSSMMMRSIQEKLVLYCVGVCFLVAISFGLYWGFSK